MLIGKIKSVYQEKQDKKVNDKLENVSTNMIVIKFLYLICNELLSNNGISIKANRQMAKNIEEYKGEYILKLFTALPLSLLCPLLWLGHA